MIIFLLLSLLPLLSLCFRDCNIAWYECIHGDCQECEDNGPPGLLSVLRIVGPYSPCTQGYTCVYMYVNMYIDVYIYVYMYRQNYTYISIDEVSLWPQLQSLHVIYVFRVCQKY